MKELLVVDTAKIVNGREESIPFAVYLPVPVSTNGRLVPGAGRFIKSSESRLWVESAMSFVAYSKRFLPEIKKEFKICTMTVILGGKGFPRSRDIDNTHKEVQDVFVASGVLRRDNVMSIIFSCQAYIEPKDKECDAKCYFVVFDEINSIPDILFKLSSI